MATIVNSKEFGSAPRERIDLLEEKLELRLPGEYRSFLIDHNGGIPSPDRCFISEIGERVVVETLFGLHDGPKHVSLEAHLEEWGEDLLPGLLPIGYEQGGNPICLKLQPPELGKVVLWDMELDRTQTNERGPTLYDVAPSFGQFMASLA